ncbi:hypothetical protein [Siccirubricoccus deserti]|uniref:YfhO family protein n=1 Tax=Siccirubricoccus deserti TaxID=2013562 RepID=A0A9X0QWZ8_9PROT|nr:hypothetical protein [Siccirubricoccus deserti]MBC4015135.1 hypothetical protein [Siccirubricoccus deserti]
MSRWMAVSLVSLAVVVAATSPLLGVPVTGNLVGRKADYALMTLHLLDESFSPNNPWPRWLLDGHGGLGAATFFADAPAAWWVALAVKRLLRLNVQDALTLSLAGWRLLGLLTTWLWLRRHLPSRPALAGAALGALLPYGALIDPWMRFAYADTAALALLPLLLLTLEHAAERPWRQGLPPVALATAALTLTSLPLAVLGAYFGLIHALAHALAGNGRRGLLPGLGGGLAGAALAACFLLPAYGLAPAIHAASLSAEPWRHDLLFYSPARERLAIIWFVLLVTLVLGLALLPVLRQAGGLAPRLRLALPAMLFASFALATAVSLPLWPVLPGLSLVARPWRSGGFLSLAVTGLAAMALAAGLRGREALGTGLGLAALPLGFLLALLAFGNPHWSRFMPAAPRLAMARLQPGAYAVAHVPATAAAAGWAESAGGLIPPHPKPPMPPGTTRLRDGYLIAAAEGRFALPQFWFPAWAAWDTHGRVPVAATPDGFVEVLLDRPARQLHVRIITTGWERAGCAVSGATLLLLLLIAADGRRRARLTGPAARGSGLFQGDRRCSSP